MDAEWWRALFAAVVAGGVAGGSLFLTLRHERKQRQLTDARAILATLYSDAIAGILHPTDDKQWEEWEQRSTKILGELTMAAAVLDPVSPAAAIDLGRLTSRLADVISDWPDDKDERRTDGLLEQVGNITAQAIKVCLEWLHEPKAYMAPRQPKLQEATSPQDGSDGVPSTETAG
jgi:hypothetical protein